jgi:hypothetical protein
MTPCNPGVLLPWKSEVRCEKGGAMTGYLRFVSLAHLDMGGWRQLRWLVGR